MDKERQVASVFTTSATTPRSLTRERAISALQRQGALIALILLAVFGVIRYGPKFYSVYNIFDAFLINNT